MTMPLGNRIGGGSRNSDQYWVLPKNRTRKPNADPGGWKLAKGPTDRGANTVKTFDTKRAAKKRGKQLAKKNNTALTVFDAAKKQSRQFSYK